MLTADSSAAEAFSATTQHRSRVLCTRKNGHHRSFRMSCRKTSKLLLRLGKGGGEDSAAEGSFAQRMMEKMGWKEGLGLGRSHQGITTPLEHQKTDKRSGIIKAAEQIARLSDEGLDGPPDKKARGVSFQGTPSRVILLRNIVGPGKSA